MFILSLWICESVNLWICESVTGVVESANANNEHRNQLIFWLIWNNFLAANYIYWHYTKAFWIIKFTLGIHSLSENYYNVESKPGFYLCGSSRLILSYGFAAVNICLISQILHSVSPNNWLLNRSLIKTLLLG